MNEVRIYSSDSVLEKELKFDFYIEKIFTGRFLGIASSDFIVFYDWSGEHCVG